jgi:DNA-binding NtrC family response regulator
MNTAQLTKNAGLLVSAGSEPMELVALLENLGYQPLPITSPEAIDDLTEILAFFLIDLRGNGDALRTVRLVRARQPQIVVIGLADPAKPSAAADAIRAGVFDVLPRPPSARDLESLLANAREQQELAASVAPARQADQTPAGIVGHSPAMRAVLELVQRAAAGRCGLLICGERGSGRETIARAIHAHGPPRDSPFVVVDGLNTDSDDAEQDLFGEPARQGQGGTDRRGLERLARESRLYDAAGGILFLENVTDLPARAQTRLVRIMRDREVLLDDQSEPVALDVRVIATADVSLEAALEEGRLRRDLYERLSLIRIDVPPLRQRREDIPALATLFLKDACRRNKTAIKTLTRAALTLLSALPWRGNAPELRALLERLVLLVPHGLVRLEDVLAHIQLDGSVGPTGYDATLKQARARFERDYIGAVLQHHHGRIADAAKVLGIQRTNLYRKMRRLNLMRARKPGTADVS